MFCPIAWQIPAKILGLGRPGDGIKSYSEEEAAFLCMILLFLYLVARYQHSQEASTPEDSVNIFLSWMYSMPGCLLSQGIHGTSA